MPAPPAISVAEWKIMRLLWTRSPQAAYDIIQSLHATEGWHPNTVRTLLARLLKKKALKAVKYKNLYLYTPAITESACVQAESDSFLARVFGGAVQPMLLHFVRRQKLSGKDLKELQRKLEETQD